jgi:hypothetical protein
MTEHLHADDVPLTLSVLRALVGHRADREQLGYRPDEWGADVDWDLLASGKLSTTEKATVHIARGCAIIERHGGGLPNSVSGPIRAAHRRTHRQRTATLTTEPARPWLGGVGAQHWARQIVHTWTRGDSSRVEARVSPRRGT